MNSLKRGRLYILAAAVCWSGSGASVKLVAPLNGWHIASIRSLFACLFIAAMVKPWRSARWWPSGTVALLGLINAAMLTLFVMANMQTTSANAIFLQDMAPVWVSLFAPWLLHEKFRMSDLRSLLICALGMSLFFLDKLTPGQWTGNMLAVGSGVLYALVLIGLRWGRKKEAPAAALPSSSTSAARTMTDGEALLMWGNLFCFLIGIPFMHTSPFDTGDAGLRPLLIVAGMGVFQLGLGYYLMSKGIAEVPALEAGLLALLEPVLNPVWAFLFAHEEPGRWAMVGGAIILLNLAWQSVADSPKPVSPEALDGALGS